MWHVTGVITAKHSALFTGINFYIYIKQKLFYILIIFQNITIFTVIIVNNIFFSIFTDL